MSSTVGAFGRWRIRPQAMWPDGMRLALGLTAFGLLVLLAILFAARRLAGGFVEPLGGAGMVAAAAAAAILAAGASALTRHRRKESTEYSVLSTQYLFVQRSLAGAAAIVLLASVTLSDSPAWGVALSWFTLVGSESACWITQLRQPRRAIPTRATADLLLPEAEAESSESIPENVVQQLTRVREADGSESLHALVRAEIPAGDRVAVAHLAFCPPLDAEPELTAHAIDADDADVRITTARTYGMRLEVRAGAKAGQPRLVLVEVVGRCPVISRSA